MGKLQTFEELRVYQEACDLRRRISTLVRAFPGHEKFTLRDQIVRASRSVPANIAEGYGRHHHQENIQFCRVARGSLSETLEHLNCARDEEYLTVEEYGSLRASLERTWHTLNGYMAYLKKCKKDGCPSPHPV